MHFGFDVKISHLEVFNCKKTFKSSCFVRVSYDIFPDVFFDLARMRSNDNCVLKGGVLSVINSNDFDIKRDQIMGNISICVLSKSLLPDNDGLEVAFRSEVVSSFALDSAQSAQTSVENENLKLNIEEIFGANSISFELFRDIHQEPRIVSGLIDVTISVFSFTVQSMPPKRSICLNCESKSGCSSTAPTVMRSIGVDAIEIPPCVSPMDADICSDDSSNGSLDDFIDSFNTKYGYTTKQTTSSAVEPALQLRIDKVNDYISNPITESQDISIDRSREASSYPVAINSHLLSQSKQNTNIKVNTKKNEKRNVDNRRKKNNSTRLRIEPAPTRFLVKEQRKGFDSNEININKSEVLNSDSVEEYQVEYNQDISLGDEYDMYRAPTASAVRVLFAATEANKLGIVSEAIKEEEPLLKSKNGLSANLNCSLKQPLYPPIAEPECVPLSYLNCS
mmetsp:Transcript_30359/g.43482  ORF Transcript_30359/g.43482 Transcript_30359/m.43482 type:complete len:450 (+) Transcript_30359:45-1394(+)